jgi:hypothetical protein
VPDTVSRASDEIITRLTLFTIVSSISSKQGLFGQEQRASGTLPG